MKKASSEIMLSVFAIILILLVLVLLIPNIAKPSMEIYGDKQAHVLARNLANTINALSYSEKAEIKKTLDGEWDISISKNKITASHDDFKGSEDLLAKNVKNANLKSVSKILIIKEGDFIEVKQV